MRFSRYLAAAAALSMAVVPAMASATNPAASLSLAGNSRAATKSAKNSDLFGGSVILEVVIAAAIIAGIIIIADDNNSKSP